MAALIRRLPPWGHQSSRCASTWTSGRFCGGAVFLYCIDGGGPRRRGVVGSQRRVHDDGRAQEGGAVWRRGGVNGRPGKVVAWIPVVKMSSRKMEAATSERAFLARG
jgi:hypothetical protein